MKTTSYAVLASTVAARPFDNFNNRFSGFENNVNNKFTGL